MFDTVQIGKKIKQARIDRNMTQMNLADAMGVSYQAVSNWERGNSMPDISKLGDLCAALDISVNELLGIEAPAVAKAMAQEELTMEELAEAAPVLPPKMIQEQMQSRMKIMQSRLQEGLTQMSEKLEQAFGEGGTFERRMGSVLDAVDAGRVTVHIHEDKKKRKKLDLSRIADMAPYLDEESLNQLLENADLSDLDGLDEIAPFLRRETLEELVERAAVHDLEMIVDIAPFLGKEALDKVVRRCAQSGDLDGIEEVAPFLSKETLEWIVSTAMERKLDLDLEELYPFLGKETLRKLAKFLIENRDTDALEELTSYL